MVGSSSSTTALSSSSSSSPRIDSSSSGTILRRKIARRSSSPQRLHFPTTKASSSAYSPVPSSFHLSLRTSRNSHSPASIDLASGEPALRTASVVRRAPPISEGEQVTETATRMSGRRPTDAGTRPGTLPTSHKPALLQTSSARGTLITRLKTQSYSRIIRLAPRVRLALLSLSTSSRPKAHNLPV